MKMKPIDLDVHSALLVSKLTEARRDPLMRWLTAGAALRCRTINQTDGHPSSFAL